MLEELKKEILDYVQDKQVVLFAVKSEFKDLLDIVQADTKFIEDNLKNEYVVIVK